MYALIYTTLIFQHKYLWVNAFNKELTIAAVSKPCGRSFLG